MIFTITGASGSGKTSLVRELMKQYPGRYNKIITTTTRKPRSGELDGRDYHFISKEWFLRELQQGKFIEHVVFGGNYYGIHNKDINAAFHSDSHSIVIVERKGAFALQNRYGDQVRKVYIAIRPAKAFRRLAHRDGWSKAKKRIEADKAANLFDRHGYNCALKSDVRKKELADHFDNYVIAMEYTKALREQEKMEEFYHEI